MTRSLASMQAGLSTRRHSAPISKRSNGLKVSAPILFSRRHRIAVLAEVISDWQKPGWEPMYPIVFFALLLLFGFKSAMRTAVRSKTKAVT